MTLAISIGSGKGGAGKSMVIANLALLLARAGKKVCIVDLDIGGADIHILFGLFKPQKSLTDFLTRRVDTITDVIHTFDELYGIQLVPGTGETLHTANMTFQEKKRLLRALQTIDTDVLLIDVGAGTSYHTLDFFMSSDIQLCVALPEPTSIMDFYRFLQLATIRKALGSFLSQSEVSQALKERNFQTLAEVFDMAEEVEEGARKKVQLALKYFHPLLIVNGVGANARLNKLKLNTLASKYLGIQLPSLGEIPFDEQSKEALNAYLPVVEYAPKAPSALALSTIGDKLLQVIELFEKQRQP